MTELEAANLARWRQTNEAKEWVRNRMANHGGAWGHFEWQTLLAKLEASEFWPMEHAAIGNTLETLRSEMQALGAQADQNEMASRRRKLHWVLLALGFVGGLFWFRKRMR